MPLPNEPPWNLLSEHARTSLEHAATMLAARYTGRIELICNDGNVQWIEERRRVAPKDLGA